MPSHSRSRVLAGSTIEPFRRFFDYELTSKDEMAFSFRAGTNWCHDFPKLARESGFHFNMHRRRVRVDWNRISSIDIDRVIGERDFSTIDDNVNNVVDYCLESEYDVKILDPNFVKLFRLAQLAVEYLLYCKQYLDHSVVILKEELKNRLEENAELKNELSASEKGVKELRDRLNKERSKGIEARLSDSHGEIHKSIMRNKHVSATNKNLQCPQCPKTFVSAPFLTAHVNRRHPNVSHTTPNSPGHEQYRAETEKLHSEIKSLKERLNLTERVIRNESDKFLSSDSVLSNDNRDMRNNDKDHQIRMNHRERDDIFEEQHRRYQEEIGHLKATLFDEIRSLKSADRYTHEKSDNDDCNNASTKELIRGQENEIARLRQELATKRTSEAAQKAESRRDETREELWQSKISSLEARYRADIEALYNQLRVTQKSSDQMRLDYTTRLSDLERREAGLETSLIRARVEEDRQRYGGPATGGISSLAISGPLVVEPSKNSSILEPARSRRFSGHEERSRIETINYEENSSECESIVDRPEASDDRDDQSSDAIARGATLTRLARTIGTRKHEEETSSKIHEDREKRNNNGEAGKEKTLREYLRNGEMKIRLVSNRRDESREKSANRHDESREKSANRHDESREKSANQHDQSRERSSNSRDPKGKSWNFHKGPREKSTNAQEPREKSWNRYDETRENSRNRYDEPGGKSSNAYDPREMSWYRRDEHREITNFHDPGEKSWNRHDESRDKSSAPHGPREKFTNHHAAREKSWTRRDEPREKSPIRDEPREKTPIRDEPREKSQKFRDQPREKSQNLRDQPREKSQNSRDQPREKSPNFRHQPREKSPNFRDRPREKSPNFRGARERSAAKTRAPSADSERRRTRAEVPRRSEDTDRTDVKKSTRHEVIPVAPGRQSAKLEKSRTISSSEEESDSLLESESISESSRTEDENERNDQSKNCPDQRNDPSHIVEKTRRYEKGAGENGLELFNSKLRELGVDPEWRGIPDATFAQILEIIRHHRNIGTKKYRNFEDVRRRLIHELSRRLANREKEGKDDSTNERSQLGRLVTNVKSKVSKALTILEKNDGFYGTRQVSVTMNKSARRDNVESESCLKSRPMITKEAKWSSDPRECPSSDHSYENETNAATNVNERYVDLPRKNFADAPPSTNEHKQLSHSYESIKDFIKDTNPRQARSIFNVSGGLVASTPHKNAEITVGDSSANDKKETPRDSSPAIRTVKQHGDFVTHEASNLDSPRNNGRSVLKSAIGGSIANLAKKKVLFDLESPQRNARDEGPTMYPEDDGRPDHARDSSESDFDISSIRDERDQANENKDDSAQAAKVVLLKTSQSEKIAQISQQIEKQLSIARRKPAGAVEAMFLEKFSLPSEKKDSPVNVYPNFASPTRSRRENPTLTNETITPSWQNSDSRITNLANKRDDEITNLDMDIDELLQLE